MAIRAPSTAGTRRSAARLAAVQALYQIDLAGLPTAAVIEEFRVHRFGREIDGVEPSETDAALFADLVTGYAARAGEIDALIGRRLDKDRQLDRLEAILRAILRAGAYELLARLDVPARVVISEYLNVAHAFFSGSEPGFANGVLDRLAHELRPGEF